MQEIEVNINQKEKIILNDNKILETKKTSERNIHTDLRDNFINVENNPNKENILKINQQKKENAIKLIKELQEFIKKNEEIKKKQSREECRKLCCLFFRLVFLLLIFFSLHFIFFGAFIYYNKNCKSCQATIYTKLNVILRIYIGIIIVNILMIINYILFVLSFVCIPECYGFIGFILTFLLSITQFTLSIVDLVIVQKNYNKTNTWYNCGNFKGWILFWLISNYIGTISNIFNVLCFCFCGKNK